MSAARRELSPAEKLAAHLTVAEVTAVELKEAKATYNLNVDTLTDEIVTQWNKLTDDEVKALNNKTFEELADFSKLKEEHKALYESLPDDQKEAWRKKNVLAYSENKKCPNINIVWINTEKVRMVIDFRTPYAYVWDLTNTYAQGKAIELDYKEFRLPLEPMRLLRRLRTCVLAGLLPKVHYKYTENDLDMINTIFSILKTKKCEDGKTAYFQMTSEGWHFDRNEFFYEIKVNDEKRKDSEGRQMTLVITLSPECLPKDDEQFEEKNPVLHWTLSHQTGFNEKIAYDDLVFEDREDMIKAKLVELFDPAGWEILKTMVKTVDVSKAFAQDALRGLVLGSDGNAQAADDNKGQVSKLDKVLQQKNAGQHSSLLAATTSNLFDANVFGNILGFASENFAPSAPNKDKATVTMDTD
jgi:hypothetical protein